MRFLGVVRGNRHSGERDRLVQLSHSIGDRSPLSTHLQPFAGTTKIRPIASIMSKLLRLSSAESGKSMEIQLVLQNDLNGRATKALNDILQTSRIKDAVTRVYEEEKPGGLGVGEDIKSFTIKVGAGVTAALIVHLILSFASSPDSCGTKLKASPSNNANADESLIVDADNPPKEEYLNNAIQKMIDENDGIPHN
jgi:hypothetical protein